MVLLEIRTAVGFYYFTTKWLLTRNGIHSTMTFMIRLVSGKKQQRVLKINTFHLVEAFRDCSLLHLMHEECTFRFNFLWVSPSTRTDSIIA